MLRTLTCVLTFALVALAHAAPSPSDALRGAIEQFRAGDILRADVIVSDIEDLRSASYVYRGTLVAKLDESTGLTTFRYDARISGADVPRGARFTMTADGNDAQLLVFANKTEYRTPVDKLVEDKNFTPAMPVLVLINALLAPGEDLDTAADQPGMQMRAAREGRDECHVLTVSDDSDTLELYLAESNNLPVRMDVSSPENGNLVMRLNKLRLNTRAPDSTFTIRPAPRGFRTNDSATTAASPRGTGSPSNANVGTEVGDMAPQWTLDTPSGSTKSLADYRGEYVLLDFWATWCGPCKRAMPGLQRLQNLYERHGLNVVGVNTWEENPDEAVGYMRSKRLSYELLLGGDDVAKTYGVKGIPAFFLISPEGRIIYAASGFSAKGEQRLEATIRGALGLGPLLVDPEDVNEEDLEEFEDY